MSENQQWPNSLMIVRHGESAGNVAWAAAEAAGHPMIDIHVRDADVPLSERGERQAKALGEWIGKLPSEEQPTVLLASPYIRARQTAMLALEASGIDRQKISIVIDERLREKEFGILDRLTDIGIQAHYPDQAEHRILLGKFYHRPPGGESWCDVILRLRSVIDTLTREYCEEHVVVVTHQVVVLCLRYLLERMTEEEILEIDRANRIANCSVTSYQFDQTLGRHGRLALELFNFVAPLEEAGEAVTREPDAPIAIK